MSGGKVNPNQNTIKTSIFQKQNNNHQHYTTRKSKFTTFISLNYCSTTLRLIRKTTL